MPYLPRLAWLLLLLVAVHFGVSPFRGAGKP